MICLIVAVLAIGRVAWADENFQAVQGIGVYFGVLPAAIVGGHPEWHVEGGMHGGAPSGPHQYHIVVAMFDVKTGARIENARVTANVSGLAQVGAQIIALEPMLIAGTVTYGNFVELPGSDRHDIKLDITVPGRELLCESTSHTSTYSEPTRLDRTRMSGSQALPSWAKV